MPSWWTRKGAGATESGEDLLRRKYATFRKLLSLNDECLELLASLQEDLQFVPARQEVAGARTGAMFEKVSEIVRSLEQLTGKSYPSLAVAIRDQRHDVEQFLAAGDGLARPRLSAWLSEVDSTATQEVGDKAAMLAEVMNRLHVPVSPGYILTAEAYRQFFGNPFWTRIRDESRNLDINDDEGLRACSARLTEMVMSHPLPHAIEVAITERAAFLGREVKGLAVRSSALGEGAGDKTYAGQYMTLLNVPPDRAAEAYRRVVAARFSERALFYRLATGLLEVDTPMAVLFLGMVPARASGVMYTRDPSEPKRKVLWITSTLGLGPELASGRTPGDLHVMSRGWRYEVLSSRIIRKEGRLVPSEGEGLISTPLEDDEARQPSLLLPDLMRLAYLGVQLEKHFQAPQDVEWVIDEEGVAWIMQTRPLALVGPGRASSSLDPDGEPLLSGGHVVYPGRVSGPAFLVEDLNVVSQAPPGAVLFLRKPSPEIVKAFPRITGLVAEWGNQAGHAAALLREFRVPSLFMVAGAFDKFRHGDPVSLDATRGSVYKGSFFPSRTIETAVPERYLDARSDMISHKVLALHLLDPAAINFRPGGCKSVHDVLRFCHEKAVQAMFLTNDLESTGRAHSAKLLRSSLPMDLYVLDLGGGMRMSNPQSRSITPQEIVSRPFQSLWRGFTHPGVTWTRAMPATLSDMASVMARALTPQGSEARTLSDRSYLLVADEYVNMNSRLAFHFALVDACLSDLATQNYISFRFAGGGATRARRSLRACFIERCLRHYGFRVERRGDLVNAWLKKTPAGETDAMLDILGRLMASTCQLDMYMTGHAAMEWYVQQFVAHNYSFRVEKQG